MGYLFSDGFLSIQATTNLAELLPLTDAVNALTVYVRLNRYVFKNSSRTCDYCDTYRRPEGNALHFDYVKVHEQ